MPETELFIEFSQPEEVFIPGQPISGRVILITGGGYKARAVKIKFNGCAHTSWHDYESVAKTDAEGKTYYEKKRINYSGDVNYLQASMLLWACADGSNELPPGSYAWPFSYVLSSDIPPSFEGKFGYIRYWVTAEVDRPWRFDKTSKRCITVSPHLDLNFLPHAMTPLRDQVNENLGCCCFKKGYLEMRVEIPKTGFVPGETLPINLHILNKSTVPVTKVTAIVIQRCTFVSFRHGSSFNYISQTVCGGETKRNSNVVITQSQPLTVEPKKEQKLALELRIPSVTPTINKCSPIITVEYHVQVNVDTLTTFGSGIDSEMTILIGTVPIRQCAPPAPFAIGSGVGVAPPPYPVEVQPSAPPPSYEDSMYGADGTHLHVAENEKPFVPKYPVFNNLPVYNPSAPPHE